MANLSCLRFLSPVVGIVIAALIGESQEKREERIRRETRIRMEEENRYRQQHKQSTEEKTKE